MFLGLTKALMQDYPDWPLPAPSCSVEDAAWQQLLEEANFGQVSLSEYAQVVLFEMPELMEFMLGPCSQFAPLLDKLQAAGKANIHQEAPQVSLHLPCKSAHQNARPELLVKTDAK